MVGREKCSHSDNGKKVCGPWGSKIVFGKQRPNKFLISEKIEKLIREHVAGGAKYNLKNEKYPLAICGICYLTILDAGNNIFKRLIQVMPDYKSLVLPTNTRAIDDTCNCCICLTAKFKGHVTVKKGKGKKRHLNHVINTPRGRWGSSKIVTNLPKKIKKKKLKSTKQICNTCFQEVSKGKNHKCSNVQGNIYGMIEIFPKLHRNKYHFPS